MALEVYIDVGNVDVSYLDVEKPLRCLQRPAEKNKQKAREIQHEGSWHSSCFSKTIPAKAESVTGGL